MEEKKYNTQLGTSIIALLILAAILFIISLFTPFIFTQPAIFGVNFKETGAIGDTIGGLMSPFINLSAVIVTGLAFYMQYRANKLQVQIFTDQVKETRDQFRLEQSNQEAQYKIQQFESQFFEMLRLHKENVNDLNIKAVKNRALVSKREAFVTMAEEFKLFLSYIKFGNSPFTSEYQLAYDIFFWGWNSNYVDITQLSHSWFNIKNATPLPERKNEVFFDFRRYEGYSSFLGHYYRHLFMMVNYVVNSNVIIEYSDKMKYLKILRAQLSNHEQIMLFYNWLAPKYGGAWENNKNKFFTEFKMIHNLWADELFSNQYIVDAVNGLIDIYNINPKETPLFEFQGDDFNSKLDNIEEKTLSEL